MLTFVLRLKQLSMLPYLILHTIFPYFCHTFIIIHISLFISSPHSHHTVTGKKKTTNIFAQRTIWSKYYFSKLISKDIDTRIFANTYFCSKLFAVFARSFKSPNIWVHLNSFFDFRNYWYTKMRHYGWNYRHSLQGDWCCLCSNRHLILRTLHSHPSIGSSGLPRLAVIEPQPQFRLDPRLRTDSPVIIHSYFFKLVITSLHTPFIHRPTAGT